VNWGSVIGESSKLSSEHPSLPFYVAKENTSVLPESPSSNVTSSVHPREIYLSPSISPTKLEYCAVGSALGPDWHTELRMKGGGFDEVGRINCGIVVARVNKPHTVGSAIIDPHSMTLSC